MLLGGAIFFVSFLAVMKTFAALGIPGGGQWNGPVPETENLLVAGTATLLMALLLLYQERRSWRRALLVAAMVGCVITLMLCALVVGLMIGLTMNSAIEAARNHPARFGLMSLLMLFWPVFGFVKAFRAYARSLRSDDS